MLFAVRRLAHHRFFAPALFGVSTLLAGCAPKFNFSQGLSLRSPSTACVETSATAVGSGTSGDPYQINCPAQIVDLAAKSSDWSSDYQLESDIDMTGVAINQPIGNSTTQFTGIFDGNSHTISNFTLDDATDSEVGLFGEVSGNGTSTGIIENLALTNANVTAATGTAGAMIGTLDSGLVSNCSAAGTLALTVGGGGLIGSAGIATSVWTVTHSSADVNITGNGDNQGTGGLIGSASGTASATVSDCFALGNISNSFGGTGGLVGYLFGPSVLNSYARGSITLGGTADIGGLVGLAGPATIQNCYATGNVSGNNSVGGLIGWPSGSTIVQSYSTGAVSGGTNVGGLIGYDDGTNTYTGKSYWNNTINSTLSGVGNTSIVSVVGATTTSMQSSGTYSSWSFSSIWQMPTGGVNQGYPVLQWSGNQ